MTKLDSVFKSRDIILKTNVCLVKAMVFPVVMYGCESWTIKKAECGRIDAFELWQGRRRQDRRAAQEGWRRSRDQVNICLAGVQREEITVSWSPLFG